MFFTTNRLKQHYLANIFIEVLLVHLVNAKFNFSEALKENDTSVTDFSKACYKVLYMKHFPTNRSSLKCCSYSLVVQKFCTYKMLPQNTITTRFKLAFNNFKVPTLTTYQNVITNNQFVTYLETKHSLKPCLLFNNCDFTHTHTLQHLTSSIKIKWSICTTLPTPTANGSNIYLVDSGYPRKVFQKALIKYMSPFCNKPFLALHSGSGDDDDEHPESKVE